MFGKTQEVKPHDTMKLETSSQEECEAPLLVTRLEDLGKKVVPLLRYVGVHIYHDVVLYAKLCRVFVEFFLKHSDQQKVIEEVLKISLLPGLTLIPTNPGIANELWELLKLLPYQSRFKQYSIWKETSYQSNPPLIIAKEIATKGISTKKLVLLRNCFFFLIDSKR